MSRPQVRVCVSSENTRAKVSLMSWLAVRVTLKGDEVTTLAKRAMSARLIAGLHLHVRRSFTMLVAAAVA